MVTSETMLVTFSNRFALNIRSFSHHFQSFTRRSINFSLDSCSRHFASFVGDKIMLYVIIISHSGGREKSVLSSRVGRRFIFIHQKEKRKTTPDEREKKKAIRKKSSAPAGDLANGLKLSYRVEIIFAKKQNSSRTNILT